MLEGDLFVGLLDFDLQKQIAGSKELDFDAVIGCKYVWTWIHAISPDLILKTSILYYNAS